MLGSSSAARALEMPELLWGKSDRARPKNSQRLFMSCKFPFKSWSLCIPGQICHLECSVPRELMNAKGDPD